MCEMPALLVHASFTELGFEAVLSPAVHPDDLYLKGQARPSPRDTVCYPAKLLHGHVEALLEEGVDTIFYPCMTYNFDEHLGGQPLQLPRGGLLPRAAGGQHAGPAAR